MTTTTTELSRDEQQGERKIRMTDAMREGLDALERERRGDLLGAGERGLAVEAWHASSVAACGIGATGQLPARSRCTAL